MKRCRKQFGGSVHLILVVTILSVMIGRTDEPQAACSDRGTSSERQECLKDLIDSLPPTNRVGRTARNLEDLERRGVSAEIISDLKMKAVEFDKLWMKISKELEEQDKALRAEYERAKEDAVIRRWASGLQLLATTFEFFASVSDAWGTKSDSDRDPNKTSSSEQITHEESYIFYADSDGNWKSTYIQRQVDEMKKAGLFQKDIINELNTTAETLKGASMLRDPETGGLFFGSTQTIKGYVKRVTRRKSLPEQAPPQKAAPLREVAQVLGDMARSLKKSPHLDETSSLVSILPGIGTVKDVAEVVTGKDPITGKPANRLIAAGGLLPGAKVVKAVSKAYKIAKQGKKHSGLLKIYTKRMEKGIQKAEKEIRKAIASLKKQVAKHQDKINHPSRHVPDFSKFRPQHQQSLVRHWEGEIQTFSEQIDVLDGLLKEASNEF